MIRPSQLRVALLLFVTLAPWWNLRPAGGQLKDIERQIFARQRVLPEIGRGLMSLKRNPAGRYFALVAPATTIGIYTADGKRVAEIPVTSSGGTKSLSKFVFAQDFDLEEDGRVVVVDRGANALRIAAPDGSIEGAIPVQAPTSAVALPGGQYAVTSLASKRLITIVDSQGSPVRTFGDPIRATERADMNTLYNRGRLMGDTAGRIYFVFTFLPNPTIREYDGAGYLGYTISLAASEFGLAAQDQRKDIFGIERTNDSTTLQTVINAVGMDAVTHELWVAIGNALVHFDKDGNRLLTYRTFTRDGARLEPCVILVEPDRLLLGADPLGVFDFARPDKLPAEAPKQ